MYTTDIEKHREHIKNIKLKIEKTITILNYHIKTTKN